MLFKFILLAKHYPRWLCRLITDNELKQDDLEDAIECLGLCKRNRKLVENLLLNKLFDKNDNIIKSAILAAFHFKSIKLLTKIENIERTSINNEIKELSRITMKEIRKCLNIKQ